MIPKYSQKTCGVQHAHDMGDHAQLLGRDFEPFIERRDHLSSDVFARHRVDMLEWLEECLTIDSVMQM